jgi:hypothetical protein
MPQPTAAATAGASAPFPRLSRAPCRVATERQR